MPWPATKSMLPWERLASPLIAKGESILRTPFTPPVSPLASAGQRAKPIGAASLAVSLRAASCRPCWPCSSSLAGAGVSVWWIERKVNRADFGGRWWEGLGSGLWWSVAALTTTGYGDKTPKTLLGRIVAVLWMFVGLVIISSFIASVTASLTVRHLNLSIRGFEDLPHHRVAVIAGTTSETFLRRHRIAAVPYP